MNDPSTLRQFVEEYGRVPLSWSGSTSKMSYLNFGDALSPVMVVLCGGLPVERIPFKSVTPRVAAVGTIGHGIVGGNAYFWGTGSSNYRNPSAPEAERELYRPPEASEFQFFATRGPVSREILSGAKPPAGAVYGDPVWLLPRFYRPKIEKRWELGVILHLSELTDREYDAHPSPAHRRYEIPAEFRDSVHLINTVTRISSDALKDRLDEILACKRIVSTSLHGMVIAESYDIPCLYFAPHGASPLGEARSRPEPSSGLDLRIVDLYSGLRTPELTYYVQPRPKPTDWAGLIAAIDRLWKPVIFDDEPLLQSFPLGARPLPAAAPGTTIFDHPLIKDLRFQHEVSDLLWKEKERALRRKKGR
jgi:hypothetical protein